MAEPAAFEIVNAEGTSPYVLTCEHASNFIPASYERLGLPVSDLQRHIAYDVGAAGMSRLLAKALDAPLILSGYSRLLVDCNRPVQSPTLMPVVSETTEIPGNRNLSRAEIDARLNAYYWPFQNAVSSLLDARKARGQVTILLAMHSFTPVFKGFVRPWHAGLLFRKSERLGEMLVQRLNAPHRLVEANQPYQISDDGDYTIPVHGEGRGIEAVLFEVRQDLIASPEGQKAWASLIAQALD